MCLYPAVSGTDGMGIKNPQHGHGRPRVATTSHHVHICVESRVNNNELSFIPTCYSYIYLSHRTCALNTNNTHLFKMRRAYCHT